MLKSGLADLLNISPGDDLQGNIHTRDATEILLGLLTDALDKVQDPKTRTYYQTLGQTAFAKDLY